jgi:hypothetical protein
VQIIDAEFSEVRTGLAYRAGVAARRFARAAWWPLVAFAYGYLLAVSCPS